MKSFTIKMHSIFRTFTFFVVFCLGYLLLLPNTYVSGGHQNHEIINSRYQRQRYQPGQQYSNQLNEVHQRKKRQVAADKKIFVVSRRSQDLFTVAPSLFDERTVTSATYRFVNGSVSSNFWINSTSGVVSSSLDLSNLTKVEFQIEKLTNEAVSQISVTAYFVSRDVDSRIFSNEPFPMWEVCPVWIRPGTVIYKLEAMDLKWNASDIVYSLESGGEGKFDVNPATGEVFIVGRQQFELNKIYTLVVSAQSMGVKLPNTFTPSQVLNILIGNKAPLFYRIPYTVDFYENATAGSIIHTIKAKSFQNLPLSFTMSTSSNLFSMDNKGLLKLNSPLTYINNIRQYFFNIFVSENFTNFISTTRLILNLKSINHPPEFSASNFVRYNVSENSPVGLELLQMTVRDYDPGVLGQLTLQTTDDTFRAEIDRSLGKVSLKINKALDYDSLPAGIYNFMVLAIDGGNPPLTGTASVQIWVKNENNKAPVFEPKEQKIIVREGIQENVIVTYVQAYDPDGDSIRFRLESGNTNNYFSLDPLTGALTLLKNIPAATNDIKSFNLSISITDDGSTHTTTGNVFIEVYRVNTQPTIPNCKNYAPEVTEDETQMTTILVIDAKDDDTALISDLDFSIVGDENSPFKIVKTGPKQANLTLGPSLSRTSPNIKKFNSTFKLPVTVKVTDKGIPPLTTICPMFVTVKTINKYAPVMDYGQIPTYFYFSGAQNNARIVRVFAFDQDFGLNGEVSYSFDQQSSPECSTWLNIDSNSGWITWNGVGRNTAKAQQVLNCTAIASDKGTPPKSSYSAITIRLTDSLEQVGPVWQKLNGQEIDDTYVNVLENATEKSVVATLSASAEGYKDISFFMPAENIPALNGLANFQFAKISNTSVNVVVAQARLDLPSWYLRCRAFITNKQGESIVTLARLKVNSIDVNNEIPQFYGIDSNGMYTGAVTQFSSNGDYVVTVTAIDMDRTWPNNKVTYSFQGSSSEFAIDGDTGNITVRFSTPTKKFDPFVTKVYYLTVVATDGAPSSSSPFLPNQNTVQVQVLVSGGTFGTPQFNQNFTATVAEGSPIPTNVINATASITSMTANSTFDDAITLYYIQYDGSAKRKFAVDQTTGRIYTVGPILRSDASSYSLRYAVFDGMVSRTAVVDINVSPSNIFSPWFNLDQYNSAAVVTEKDPASVGMSIANVRATSKSGRQITYRTSRPDSFSVSSTGDVTLAKTLSRDVPDGFPLWQVTVIAEDGSSPPGYAVVNLPLNDINDHAPILESCCANPVNESLPIGSLVSQLKAFDADFGINAITDFSLVNTSDTFDVTPSGEIRLKSLLNFEGVQKYTIKVKATDRADPSKSTTNDVDIIVADSGSEGSPSFGAVPYAVSIPEELPIGTPVLSIRASDTDPMDNLTYTLSGTDASFFYVDSLSAFDGYYENSTARRVSPGVIKILKRIDFDQSKKSSYNFNLIVQDSSRSISQTSVSVTVTDTNDNPPKFTVEHQTVTVNENLGVGSNVGSPFIATDADSGVNGQFSYSIDYKNSDPRFMFQVDSGSGQVSVRSELDYEWMKVMEVKVLAIDQGTPPLTGTATLTVNIQNVEDSLPVFSLPSGPILIIPNLSRGSRISCPLSGVSNVDCQLACTAGDVGCSDFALNSDCCITANKDGYSRSGPSSGSYNIPLKATSRASSLSTIRNVNIVVQGQDNTPPTAGTKSVSVMDYVGSNGAFSSIPLGNVYVVDPENWDTNLRTFSLLSGDQYFSLDPKDKNKLLLKGTTPPGQQQATVQVVNSKFPNQPATSTINVDLKYVNESALKSASSIRITGLRDVTQLLDKPSPGSKTSLELLAQQISQIIGSNSIVEILSVWNVENSSTPLVDVLYAVHGSPYYQPEKLAPLVWSNRDNIKKETGLTISMSPVDMCTSEFYGCWSAGCQTQLNVDESKPRLVNTNETSFVGLTAQFVQVCSCSSTSPPSDAFNTTRCMADSCLNGGTCMLNNSVVSCVCPPGYEGRRCQKTKVSITGPGGYVLLPPLGSCQIDRLSFEFLMPTNSPSTCLLLYNGPISEPGPDSPTFKTVSDPNFIPPDFILVELNNGRPRLRMNFGDGEVVVSFNEANLNSLVDGAWHSIDVIHSNMDISLMVDKCGKANLNENISTSNLNTASCLVKATAPKQRFLLNGKAPLQLGGRWDTATKHPQGWVKESARGCFRNLQQNGFMYDMSLSPRRQFLNAEPDCQSENCKSCPSNATCLNPILPGSPLCQCPPGFRGPNCEIPTTVKYFDTDGYASWLPTETFKQQYNNSVNTFWFSDRMELMFRTRQPDGVLFAAESFTGLERYLLEVKNKRMSFTFDLGSGDTVLLLPQVDVSDGEWHWVQVIRYGNLVEMHLDTGDGKRYNASLPTDSHRLLKINNANVLGDLNFNPWSKTTSVAKSLGKSCITDVRYGGNWWPLAEAENSAVGITATVSLVKSSDTGCSLTSPCSRACADGQYCYFTFPGSECRCQNYVPKGSSGDVCIATSCAMQPCLNGGTCVMVLNDVACVCPPNWFGPICNSTTPVSPQPDSTTYFNRAAAIAAPVVILGFLLLLLLALLIWYCCCRQKKDTLLYYEPDKDIRENVIAYDDEGAGEKDNFAFDLSRLQKSELPPQISNTNISSLNGLSPFASSRAAAPGRLLPGDYPSVADFIADRLNDIDNNPNNNADDTKVNFDFEGQGSEAGTLSSLASSDGDKDLDFGWLDGVGPRFGKLADMYGEGGRV